MSVDGWLESGAGRLQRGISLTLVVLGGMLMAIESLRHNHGLEKWVLVALVIVIASVVLNLARNLRDTARTTS